ncbi:MAG: hypothetical protein H7X79_03745 [Sporomusaceae bacterium]|nr:hypothetical protein [Sporomusaceae bacterium]
MTIIEMILSLAMVILTAQIVILQRYYGEKLEEQAVVLGDLIDIIEDQTATTEQFGKIRRKIFSSSQ